MNNGEGFCGPFLFTTNSLQYRKLWGTKYILEIDPEYSLDTSTIIKYDSETDTISNISLSWINLYNDEEKPCERKIPIWHRKL